MKNIGFAAFVSERYWPTVSPLLNPDWKRTTERYILPQLASAFCSDLSALTSETVEAWWNQTRAAHPCPTTANKFLARLKHVLNKAVQWGYLTSSPAQYVRKLREPPGRIARITNTEWETLLSLAGAVLRPYLIAARYTGQRRASLHALQERDVDYTHNVICFRHTKNGAAHVLPLHPAFREYLLHRLGAPFSPDAYVLPHVCPASVSQAFRRLCHRCGILNRRFHDTRHDVGSRLTDAGTPQRIVMLVLGHRDPRSTIRYSHPSLGAVGDAMARAL